jgi:hypothetical protein
MLVLLANVSSLGIHSTLPFFFFVIELIGLIPFAAFLSVSTLGLNHVAMGLTS